VAFGVLVVAGAHLAIIDTRTLPKGENVWLKPIRFALAFAVHGVTLVWIARLTNRVAVQDSTFAMSIWLQVVVMIIEFACVVIQAGFAVTARAPRKAPLPPESEHSWNREQGRGHHSNVGTA